MSSKTGASNTTSPTRSPSPEKPGDGWIAVIRKNGTEEFAAAFAANPVLEASALDRPRIGVDAIAAFFAATSGGLYDSLAFTYELTDGRKTFLEWEGRAFGKPLTGTTILTRNDAGLIESIRLYHLPLEIVMLVSAELEKRLGG